MNYQVDSSYDCEPPEIDAEERFEEEDQMHERVNELALLYKDRLSIGLAAYLLHEYKYKPVETIIKYEPKKHKNE